MSSIKLSVLTLLPAILGAVVVAPVASANEAMQQVVNYSELSSDDATMSSVTSVSQLSDVRPTDWAFQALQSLVERYGCIAGYPDKTYR
ncbi:S-layer homology domain-containing protein, partial [filamentous cyanobacterium LEGE 11480]